MDFRRNSNDRLYYLFNSGIYGEKMTTLKDKIKAAKEAIIRNPHRQQGNFEIDFKEITTTHIEILVNYVIELETRINNLTFELDELNAKIVKKPNRRS